MSAPGSGITVTVDQDLCMGSGYCIAQYPELFDADPDGTATARGTGALRADQAAEAAAAAHLCPASAIEVRAGN